MKEGSKKDVDRIKNSKNAAKKGMQKRTASKKNDNTRVYYIVIGVFVALCGYAVIEVFLNPKKSLSQTPAIDQNKVSIHNSKSSYQFKQGLIDFWSDKTLADAKSMFQGGFSSSPQIQQCIDDDSNTAQIPEQFDAHKNWPNCVSEIRNQGKCTSASQLQVASAMSQRRCIHQNGDYKELSAQAILTCSSNKEKICQESFANQAFYHMMEKGVPYEEDCPYDPTNLQCTEKCQESKFKAHDMCLLTKFDSIRREIMTNGPVVGFISPTIDFLPYESGFYHQVDGQQFRGQHILKIIGWTGNNLKEDSWIVQNTWGKGWGEEGKARIQMGHMPMYALKASVEETVKQSQQSSQVTDEIINIDLSEDESKGKKEFKEEKVETVTDVENQGENKKDENDQKDVQSGKKDQSDQKDESEKPNEGESMDKKQDKTKINEQQSKDDSKDQQQMAKNEKAKQQNAKDDKPKKQEPKEEKPQQQKAKDEKPQEQKSKDEKPQEQKAKDEKPQEQKPKEEKPQEQKPKEEKPQEQKPKEEKPQQQKSQQEKPQQQKAKDQKPQEQKPQEEKPQEQKSQEEKPQQQKAKDDKSQDKNPKKDKSNKDKPKKQKKDSRSKSKKTKK